MVLEVQAGLVVATGAEPAFQLLGFLACLLATVMRALKTVLQVIEWTQRKSSRSEIRTAHDE